MRLRPRFALFAVIAAIGTLVAPASSLAAAVARDTWCANGEVWAIAPTDSVVYMAGAFNFIGAPTGSFVVIDSTGEPVLPLPEVVGGVYAVAADGQGGWFIGGGFVSVQGHPRQGLAHVLADGTLAPWNPGTSGTIYAMAVDGGRLYVGGTFSA